MNEIILKPGRDKTARQRHPWIFSGGIMKTPSGISPGEIVRVVDSKKNFVAYGYHNPNSQIAIRLLEWNENALIDDSWWQARIADAVARRKHFIDDSKTNAFRLVFGESDLFPGLVVDRYADFIVMQALTAGIESVKIMLASHLNDLLKPSGIYERSDTESRTLEGLEIMAGQLLGAAPPDRLIVTENGYRLSVDIKSGQKTGLYLDQRDNHKAVASYAAEKELLDCFSYTGAFSVHALGAGAKSVTLVDSSAQSLKTAQQNIQLNRLDETKSTFIDGDAFQILRQFRDSGRSYDMVILDPPKFAPTKSDLKKALSGYKDINLLALKILRPGGILVTFSCSGAVDAQTLQTVLFWAATDAGRNLQIIRTFSQGEDHPRLVTFPESEYLKGFICRVF